MKKRDGARENPLLLRHLRGLYNKQIATLAEHSCVCAITRGEYPYVSDMFEGFLKSDTETLLLISELLLHLGIAPALDVKMRQRIEATDHIDKLICAELERKRGEIDEILRIYSLTNTPEILEKVEQMRLNMSENLRALERMALS